MRSFSALSLLLGLCCCGCTYSFRGQTAGAIKSIAVPTFENESTEFGLGERVTENLIRAFQRDGVLRVTGEDQADAILHGRILRVDDQPYTARPNELVDEYRFWMSCDVELVDSRTQQPLWSQVYPAWAIYAYGGTLENREQAIQEATAKLQQDLLNRIVGSW